MGPKQQIEARLCVGKSTPRTPRITLANLYGILGVGPSSYPSPPGLLRMPGSDWGVLGNYLIGLGINKQVRQLERLLARH